jgi:hypothetical protein
VSDPHHWSTFAESRLAHRARIAIVVALVLALIALTIVFAIYNHTIEPS